jgi:hypothetical protein
VTRERGGPRKSGFLPFLAAVLLAAALLALIGWQALPWREHPSVPDNGNSADNAQPTAAAPSAPASAAQPAGTLREKPSPMPSPAAQAAPAAPVAPGAPTATQPAVPDSSVPSAAAPNASNAAPARQTGGEAEAGAGPARGAPAEPAHTPTRPVRVISSVPAPRAPIPASQTVTVSSSPGGATATLDGRSETACTTPCELEASPGRHTIGISMPAYQIERREVTVGTSPLELETVILRPYTGTLMLTSVPPGAAIRINGKTLGRLTPAQLSLPPGTYKVTVEKDGAAKTTDVDIRNDETKILKVLLGQ